MKIKFKFKFKFKPVHRLPVSDHFVVHQGWSFTRELTVFGWLLFDIRWNTEPLYGYLRRNRSSDYLRLKRLSLCHSSHLVRWRQWNLPKNVLLTHLEFLLCLLTGCFFNFLVSVVYVVVLRSLVALLRKTILDMWRLCLKNGRFDEKRATKSTSAYRDSLRTAADVSPRSSPLRDVSAVMSEKKLLPFAG